MIIGLAKFVTLIGLAAAVPIADQNIPVLEGRDLPHGGSFQTWDVTCVTPGKLWDGNPSGKILQTASGNLLYAPGQLPLVDAAGKLVLLMKPLLVSPPGSISWYLTNPNDSIQFWYADGTPLGAQTKGSTGCIDVNTIGEFALKYSITS